VIRWKGSIFTGCPRFFRGHAIMLRRGMDIKKRKRNAIKNLPQV
jgi:hypothetical protein